MVLLGGPHVLASAGAPKTAEPLADLGHEPVVVDFGEFEKLAGRVTCLSSNCVNCTPDRVNGSPLQPRDLRIPGLFGAPRIAR